MMLMIARSSKLKLSEEYLPPSEEGKDGGILIALNYK